MAVEAATPVGQGDIMTTEKTTLKRKSNINWKKIGVQAGTALAHGLLSAAGALIVTKLATASSGSTDISDNVLQLKKQG